MRRLYPMSAPATDSCIVVSGCRLMDNNDASLLYLGALNPFVSANLTDWHQVGANLRRRNAISYSNPKERALSWLPGLEATSSHEVLP